MFTFAATPVMYVGLFVLFAWCTLWSAVELIRSTTPQHRVSNALHLVMSVVMLAMVPRSTYAALSAVVPVGVQAGFFLLAALWFVALAVRTAGPGRGHFIGHALMFAAMTWHLVGMMVKMAQMAGHGMGEHAAPGMTGSVDVIAWVGLPFMAALAWMGCASLVAWVRPVAERVPTVRQTTLASVHAADHHRPPVAAEASCHEPRPVGSDVERAHHAMGAAMNLGMFWMSVGLVTPLLPFLAVLHA